MKIRVILILLLLLIAPSIIHAQLWSNILNPVSGAGACNPASISSPQACAIDWTTAGVVGGIPSATWTQSGSTITASSGDRTSTIQTALNGCGTNHFVLLGPGTFNVTNLTIPSNCVLRGSGTLTSTGTIINLTGTSGAAYTLGTTGVSFNPVNTTTISSGATAGSTSLTVSSTTGITANTTLLAVSELNDPVYVTIVTPNGTCSFCDGTSDSGARARGQIVLVTNVAGSVLTISPPLYSNYGSATSTSPALGYPFAISTQNAGVESLQTYSNGTGYSRVYSMTGCMNCWIKGVMDNYADADHVDDFWGLHDEIRDSYFAEAYLHTSGQSDSEVDLLDKTSATLIENNIFERLHVGIMLEWGAAGNVIGYNYEIGNFDSSGALVILAFIDFHGASPQFNLFEGNIGNNVTYDSFWGSSSNNTLFRNNFRATDTLASPLSAGRNTVNWASFSLANQQMMGEQFAFPHTNINTVGNVLGSADANSTASTKYNSGTSPFTSTIIPSATRTYNNFFSAISLGYDTGSDTSGSGVATFAGGPSSTAGYWVGKASGTVFQHGNYDIASGSIIWNGSTTHTLPASFYRSSKPVWFGNVPWPAIGPDVSGGAVDNTVLAGHVNANPALVCYNSESRDATGIKLFDPSTCYATSLPPSITAPAPQMIADNRSRQ